VLNDRPDLAVAAGAHGVHLGQDDMALEQARAIVGPHMLIGRSTHTPEQIDSAHGADYIGVGPVHATPTKLGRPAVGLDLVGYAAAHAAVPFFAIGGIDETNIGAVVAAGACASLAAGLAPRDWRRGARGRDSDGFSAPPASFGVVLSVSDTGKPRGAPLGNRREGVRRAREGAGGSGRSRQTRKQSSTRRAWP